IGPRIEDSFTAGPQSPKNSACLSAGLREPTSARPDDCEDPRHSPARLAATQKSPDPDADQAIKVVAIHSTRVKAMVRTCPSRSWMLPKANAPTAAVTLTTRIRAIVSFVVKPRSEEHTSELQS